MRKMAVRLGLALAILAAAGGAYAWWRSTRPRILKVWVLTDYAFRQRPDWEKAVRGRFDEVNRLFAQGTGVQWMIVDLDRADPTAQQPGISDRRRSLEQYPEFRADLIASFTGLQATGPAASPFGHAVVIPEAKDAEERNVMNLARALAHLFGAPTEAKGAGTVMTGPPEAIKLSPATVRLIHDLRGFDFSNGIKALNDKWQRRAVSAIATALHGRQSQPLAGAHEMVALAFQNEGKYVEALAQIREAVKIDPRSVRLRVSLAATLMQTGDLEAALAEARDAVRIDPNSAEAHTVTGVLLSRHGDSEEAAEELERASQLAPKDPAIYGALSGVLLSIPGGVDRAAQVLQKLLAATPDSEAAKYSLARIEAIRQSMVKSMAEARAAAQSSPNDPGAHATLGRAEFAAANFDAAAREFARAIQIEPKNGRVYLELARARYFQKDYTGAWGAVQSAQQLGYRPQAAFLTALQKKQPQ